MDAGIPTQVLNENILSFKWSCQHPEWSKKARPELKESENRGKMNTTPRLEVQELMTQVFKKSSDVRRDDDAFS